MPVALFTPIVFVHFTISLSVTFLKLKFPILPHKVVLDSCYTWMVFIEISFSFFAYVFCNIYKEIIEMVTHTVLISY